MQRMLLAALTFGLVLMHSAFAGSGPGFKALDPAVPFNAVRTIRVQLVDGSGKPVAQTVAGASVRVDMSPDAMADMTADAKIVKSEASGVVTVQTNLYVPGRWVVILKGNVAGKPVSGSVVVTATRKSAEAASPSAPWWTRPSS
jgi:Cu(I)/Ag(I) efflux system membrane fusion protein